ncbi:Transporter substrate-binding domain-containing protein [Rhodovastum atsumiense]|uniref:Transporter substrate-binding domain-containing protein n=1 Tax=Rhodovastum atsumiense TaxID=504468 RepID=A0A5M6ITR0_9PROT|nr:transporter substrate-binding domain-containing protein [Rhodovastum atsumiense]KAA5611309.1 transporter substrate-binding domain-containing protein [Rhodovastum atsumiense]CAH2601781.1 Transporter substrate-binding domain-containing protein [Rhodovastum atsumiense]
MTNRLSRRGLATAAAAVAVSGFFIGRARADAPESTFERVTRTKVLRIAVLPGEMPYFFRDLATGEWTGSAIEMAKSIASVWNAKLEYVESTYGNSVLDLQANKVDLAFALAPTPQRALSIGFTRPVIVHPYGVLAKKGFLPSSWADINRPDVRISCDLGSTNEVAARRFAPKAQITAYRNRDEALLALQSGRADVNVLAAMLALAALAKNPGLGSFRLLTTPLIALPSSLGVQREPDTRFREVVDAWIDMNRGTGQIREWMIQGILKSGARPEDIPPELSF